MGFSTADYFIVAAYLAAMAVWGVIAGGSQRSTRDYFLGSKNIPWWAACFAIVATETSTLTFISIPGLAYATNLNFLQLTFGYLIGRVVVSWLLLPAYARGDLVTAYQFLGERFGTTLRRLTSATFMVTRLLADGVRLFATAIPLAILLKGWKTFVTIPDESVYMISIGIMAAITLVYTFVGGVRAVIWTDVVQMFIYLGGAGAAAIVLLADLPEGLSLAAAVPEYKLAILNAGGELFSPEFWKTSYTLPASLLGGAFLSMASHGTDQIIVQRLLTVGSLRGSQKALVVSGAIVILQFALFLCIGLLLYAYYNGAELVDLGLHKADEIFPKFILERMPSGLSGLIIAGLLAAAMSTLSGSINSLAAATMHDFYQPLVGGNNSDERGVFLSRVFSFVWCVLLVGVAIFFITTTSKALVELALSIASVTYGGLLGAFLLGVLFKSTTQADAITAFLAGIIVMVFVFTQTAIAWTWYTVIGAVSALAIGNLSRLVRISVRRLEGNAG